MCPLQCSRWDPRAWCFVAYRARHMMPYISHERAMHCIHGFALHPPPFVLMHSARPQQAKQARCVKQRGFTVQVLGLTSNLLVVIDGSCLLGVQVWFCKVWDVGVAQQIPCSFSPESFATSLGCKLVVCGLSVADLLRVPMIQFPNSERTLYPVNLDLKYKPLPHALITD